ncbi:MAG: outer membrane protein transport protein, partial [Candidatus Cloacimonadota bacterium]|nr:outer membrane protein transport protein [Candidatus Cloacimonadota bacterium]
FIQKYKNEDWAVPPFNLSESVMKLNWEDCTQIRLGAEFKPCDKYAYRLGYYYDPAPAPDETLNILFPSMTNNVFTGGFGYKTEKLNVDFGIEYLMGEERDVTTATADNMPGKHQMDILAFSLGFGYNF